MRLGVFLLEILLPPLQIDYGRPFPLYANHERLGYVVYSTSSRNYHQLIPSTYSSDSLQLGTFVQDCSLAKFNHPLKDHILFLTPLLSQIQRRDSSDPNSDALYPPSPTSRR
jgi:hypothetical protein